MAKYFIFNDRINFRVLCFIGFHRINLNYSIVKKIQGEKLEPNSVIYDPFIGSGTTAISGNLLGYDVIGIDESTTIKSIQISTISILLCLNLLKYH